MILGGRDRVERTELELKQIKVVGLDAIYKIKMRGPLFSLGILLDSNSAQ